MDIRGDFLANWDNLPQSAKGRYQGVTWKITCADQISIVSNRLRCARCPILTPEGQLPIYTCITGNLWLRPGIDLCNLSYMKLKEKEPVIVIVI